MPREHLTAELLISVGACGAALWALALGLQAAFDLTSAWMPRVLIAYAGGGALLIVLARRHLRGAAFGAANRVTLARGALIALLAGLLGEQARPSLAWLAVVLATVVLLLDGVDGWLARRTGSAGSFGARFDMETDALLILAMAALAWYLGKAGAWIWLAGLLRYAFVAAALALAWMRRQLPASRRRQTVCVLQIVSLIACLSPIVVPPASAAIGLAGLLLLCCSFAVDVLWLVRAARAGVERPAL